MKFIYPAVFHKTEEGHYKGYFPDLECCYGEGETLDEAIESANEAARDWITLELSEDEPMIPQNPPSLPGAVPLSPDALRLRCKFPFPHTAEPDS